MFTMGFIPTKTVVGRCVKCKDMVGILTRLSSPYTGKYPTPFIPSLLACKLEST